MDSALRGTNGLVIGYGVVALGVLIGMLLGRAKAGRVIFFPVIAIPVFVVIGIAWTVLAGLLKSTPLRLQEILGMGFFLMAGGLAGRIAVFIPVSTTHKRGALLEPAAALNPRKSRTNRLTLAGHPVEFADETKHFKMIGTTGTGKSTAIRELLGGALARGDRAVITDPDGGYLSRFYDPSRGDVILNPFDPRGARWDLFGEITSIVDADQMGRSLIADQGGQDRNWRNYARVLLTSLLRQLHRAKHNDLGQLVHLLSVADVDDLREVLADTAAGSFLAQDNGKFFGAVRAIANTHVAALEHVARQESGTSLSVRNWIRGGQAGRGVLFLPYRANEIASLAGLISTWMRLAIFETLSQPEGDQRLWFIVDELDALGPIDGLKDALARLRKFGGRCVLGFQSIAQVSGTNGHAEAQTIVENCGNTLILRCSSSEGGGTAQFASRLIGEREIIRKQVSKTRQPRQWGSAETTSEQHVTEAAVMPSEIEQLPDLAGYLKLASRPEWLKIQMHPS